MMTIDSIISKLNQSLEMAKQTLRVQLLEKVTRLTEHLEDFSNTEIREELENLVDDFIYQFTNVYQEFISYIEVELPISPKPQPKPKRKKKKSEKKKNEFIRPTYVHRAFNDFGLRVAKNARPIIMDFLNKKIEKDIDKIKMQIPTYQKGEKKGEKKRITIKPEDLVNENLLKESEPLFEKELEIIPLDFNGKDYKLSILLRHLD